ncbi:MAG: polyprenyl synthetase family protein [Crocosphaera sp.]|nr:polyprenyl synthetase family protein [Crocosphaera sp.]
MVSQFQKNSLQSLDNSDLKTIYDSYEKSAKLGFYSSNISEIDEVELEAINYVISKIAHLSDQEMVSTILSRSLKEENINHQISTQFLLDYRQEVILATEKFINEIDIPEDLKTYYLKFFEETSMMASLVSCLPVIDFPVIVHVAQTGINHQEEAIPLSVAALLYYMGISLYDDLIDEDLTGWWQEQPSKLIGLAAISIFSGLPIIYLQDYDDKKKTNYSEKLAPLLQTASYQMSVGQFLDIGSEFTNTSAEKCEEIIQLKTGSTGNLVAKMAAKMITDDQDLISQYGLIFQYLYMAMQITSDIHDIWGKPISPDLANAIPTLPIIHGYSSLEEAEKEQFEQKLKSLNNSQNDHDEMRNFFYDSGSFSYTLMRAEFYKKLSWQQFEKLGLSDSARENLFSYVYSVSTLV